MYKRLTRDVYVVQGFYARWYGWEDLVEEETVAEAIQQRRCYDKNEVSIPHRVVKRRVKIGVPHGKV